MAEIEIRSETKRMLDDMRGGNESYDDVIRRLIQQARKPAQPTATTPVPGVEPPLVPEMPPGSAPPGQGPEPPPAPSHDGRMNGTGRI